MGEDHGSVIEVPQSQLVVEEDEASVSLQEQGIRQSIVEDSSQIVVADTGATVTIDGEENEMIELVTSIEQKLFHTETATVQLLDVDDGDQSIFTTQQSVILVDGGGSSNVFPSVSVRELYVQDTPPTGGDVTIPYIWIELDGSDWTIWFEDGS